MPKLRVLLLPLLVILLGYTLRILRLADAAIWWDEGWSFWNAHQNLSALTRSVAHDSHPPLYQWALHGWMQVAGITEFALRWLAVLAGTLTVAVSLALGTRLSGSRRAGLLAGLLVALSAFHVQWSQEIRMYAFPTLFATLATYAYARVSSCNRRAAGWWALLILAGAAAPLSHYLAGFMLVILNLHWLLTARHRTRVFNLRWIGALALSGALVGAWLIYALPRIRGGGGNADVALASLFRLMATMLAVGKSTDLNRYTPVTVALAALFGSGLLLWVRQNRTHAQSALLIVLSVIVPPIVILLLAMPWTDLFAPPPSARYFVIFTPVIVTGLGIALAQITQWRRWLGTTAILGVLITYGWAYSAYLSARHYQDDYASLVAATALLAEPDDPIYYISGDRYSLFYYHWQRATDQHPASIPTGLTAPPPGEIADFAQRTFGDQARFWLVEIEAHLGDPDGNLRAWIAEHYTAIYRTTAAYNTLTLYARDPNTAPPATTTILPPAAHDLWSGDVARLGIPAGTSAELVYDQRIIATHTPETWQLVAFPIYDAYPPGAYTLRAGDAAYTLRITGTAGDPDTPAHALDADFGPLRLIGYTLHDAPFVPGSSQAITLYWRVDETPAADLTVFLHLLGPPNPVDGSPVWAGADSYPAQTPTTMLWPDLTFADHHTLTIPADMPPGWVSLEVGLYDLASGARLSLPDGADRILIPGVEVRACTRLLRWCF